MSPVSVTTGDFNADGKLDLATANYNTDNVSVLLGNGTGSFAAAVNFGAGDGPDSSRGPTSTGTANSTWRQRTRLRQHLGAARQRCGRFRRGT